MYYQKLGLFAVCLAIVRPYTFNRISIHFFTNCIIVAPRGVLYVIWELKINSVISYKSNNATGGNNSARSNGGARYGSLHLIKGPKRMRTCRAPQGGRTRMDARASLPITEGDSLTSRQGPITAGERLRLAHLRLWARGDEHYGRGC